MVGGFFLTVYLLHGQEQWQNPSLWVLTWDFSEFNLQKTKESSNHET